MRVTGECVRQRTTQHHRDFGLITDHPGVHWHPCRVCERARRCALRPLSVPRWRGRQVDRAPLLRLRVGRKEIFEERTPGDPIHHEVVCGEQELLGARGVVHVQGPDQWPVLQVEGREQRGGGVVDGRRCFARHPTRGAR